MKMNCESTFQDALAALPIRQTAEGFVIEETNIETGAVVEHVAGPYRTYLGAVAKREEIARSLSRLR